MLIVEITVLIFLYKVKRHWLGSREPDIQLSLIVGYGKNTGNTEQHTESSCVMYTQILESILCPKEDWMKSKYLLALPFVSPARNVAS